jgi:hypothetical protein
MGGLSNPQSDWQRDPGVLLGLSNMGLGPKPKSLVDLIQVRCKDGCLDCVCISLSVAIGSGNCWLSAVAVPAKRLMERPSDRFCNLGRHSRSPAGLENQSCLHAFWKLRTLGLWQCGAGMKPERLVDLLQMEK